MEAQHFPLPLYVALVVGFQHFGTFLAPKSYKPLSPHVDLVLKVRRDEAQHAVADLLTLRAFHHNRQ